MIKISMKIKKSIKIFIVVGLIFTMFARPTTAQSTDHSVYHSLRNNYTWIQFCTLSNQNYKNAINQREQALFSNNRSEVTKQEDNVRRMQDFLINKTYGDQLTVPSGKIGDSIELSVQESDNMRSCLLTVGPSLQELVGQTPLAQGTGNVGSGNSAPLGPCQADTNLLSFPTWYKYLNPVGAECEPQIRSLKDIWLVAAAILDILLRLGALLSVGFIVWAGFRFLTSQGDPGTIKESRDTIINAVIGLVITVIAAISVNFIAGRF